MPWKEMSVMDRKEEFILLGKSGKYTLKALAEMFGISRPTAYKWRKRYEREGLPGLFEHTRKPRRTANKTPERIEEEIIALRHKPPRWGSPKLLVLLEDRFPREVLPKVSTVNLILKRNELVATRKGHRKVEAVHPVFDPKKSNEVWSADFKGKFRLGNGRYCYPLTIADSYSRYVFAAKGLYATNGVNTKPVFIEVFRKYGLPEQIHTDNGAPFASVNALGRLSKLSVWFMELGIEPVFSDPAHPEQNGRHERMHRELKGEATKPPGYSLQRQQTQLNAFVREYNELRPHDALGLRTPSAVHEISLKEYPEKIVEWEYPKEYTVRYVTKNGAFRAGAAHWIFVSTALRGKNVGLEELGNRIYRLYFRRFFLGYLDVGKRKVYDVMNYTYEYKV